MSFRPARWLPGGHTMTIFGALARRPPRLPTWRERWELPDGDFLDVERLAGPRPGSPLVVICHGLEGSSESGYVRDLLACARRLGLGGVALNFRGCSGEVNRLPRFYHSGETGDLAYTIDRLRAERPGRPLLVAGFSLGGNVAGKYLGERGDDLPAELRAAALVCAPFDLARCADEIDRRGLAPFIYRSRFLRRLKQKALGKARLMPDLFDVRAARAARTLRAFDDAVTAPLHGFRDARDYYARSSAGPLLARIRRRTLILYAKDDPLIPPEVVPGDLGGNPWLVVEPHERGGHVGFVEADGRFFCERRVAEFLAGCA